jgi:hypothetical protein
MFGAGRNLVYFAVPKDCFRGGSQLIRAAIWDELKSQGF